MHDAPRRFDPSLRDNAFCFGEHIIIHEVQVSADTLNHYTAGVPIPFLSTLTSPVRHRGTEIAMLLTFTESPV
jgi:hypothetical protein